MTADETKLRGFGPVGILSILVIAAADMIVKPLSAILVLVWARKSGTPWSAIGFGRPRSWPATIAEGISLGIAFKLVMKAVVMPLFGADPINPTYHYLAGNAAALPAMFYAVIVGAGFGEETFYRGFLFERLGALFGRSAGAKGATVVLSAILFGLAHWHDQGRTGVEQATIVGLVFGTIFTRTGRIWMLMLAHAAFDVTAVLLIYWNLESFAAHVVFK